MKGRLLPLITNVEMESLLTMLETTESNVSKKLKTERKLARIWREIQGTNNREGLFDPMDDILRKDIINYGEFVQACYDGFEFDPFSKYSGSCKYNCKQLFQGIGMSYYGYEVAKYLYSTSNINLLGVFHRPRCKILWSTYYCY
jgi:muconolactone delta-isomerase